MSIFSATEFVPIEEAPKYKKGMGSRALVASDGRGEILIDWIGSALEYWRYCVDDNELLQDLGGAPVGISIWEGTIHGSTNYWGEYDAELVGEYRPLTDEEWEDYKLNGEVWDRREWFEDEQEKPDA